MPTLWCEIAGKGIRLGCLQRTIRIDIDDKLLVGDIDKCLAVVVGILIREDCPTRAFLAHRLQRKLSRVAVVRTRIEYCCMSTAFNNCLTQMIFVDYSPLTTIGNHCPLVANRSALEIVVGSDKGTILFPIGRTSHHQFVTIPSYTLKVQQSTRLIVLQVMIAEEIGVEIRPNESRTMSQSLMSGCLRVDKYRILIPLWMEP